MIGSVIAATLPLMRAQAESLMTDTCAIDRANGDPAWSEEDQESVQAWTPIYADVPCHVDESLATSRSLLAGEAVTRQSSVVKMPYTTTGVQPDDRITIGDLVLWVTQCSPDDTTHPVEMRAQCRTTR